MSTNTNTYVVTATNDTPDFAVNFYSLELTTAMSIAITLTQAFRRVQVESTITSEIAYSVFYGPDNFVAYCTPGEAIDEALLIRAEEVTN